MDDLLVLAAGTSPEYLAGPVVRALVLGHTVVLAMALPFTVLAVRGYSGAPWARAIKPLPVVTAALLLSSALNFVLQDPGTSNDARVFLWGVAAVGIGWSVLQAFLLLTGRRAV